VYPRRPQTKTKESTCSFQHVVDLKLKMSC
jgi:hypothetical protein